MAECKDDYDKKCANAKKKYDPKSKKWVKDLPREGYVSKAVRGYFKNLKNMPSTDQKFKNALRYAQRCLKIYEHQKQNDAIEEEPSKKRFRSEGAGRKAQAPEVRDALFEWFIGNFGISISLLMNMPH